MCCRNDWRLAKDAHRRLSKIAKYLAFIAFLPRRGTFNGQNATFNARRETGDARRATRSGHRETFNVRREGDNGQNGTFNGRRETDNGRSTTGVSAGRVAMQTGKPPLTILRVTACVGRLPAVVGKLVIFAGVQPSDFFLAYSSSCLSSSAMRIASFSRSSRCSSIFIGGYIDSA